MIVNSIPASADRLLPPASGVGQDPGTSGEVTGSWWKNPLAKIRELIAKIRDIVPRFTQIFDTLRNAGARLQELIQRAQKLTDQQASAAVMQKLSELQQTQARLDNEGTSLVSRIETIRRKLFAEEDRIKGELAGMGLGLLPLIPLFVLAGVFASAAAVVASAYAWMKSSETQVAAIDAESRALDAIESGTLTAGEYRKVLEGRGIGSFNLEGSLKWIAIGLIAYGVVAYILPMVSKGRKA